MNVKSNVKSIVINTIDTPLSLGSTALQLTADGANLVNKTASATPAVLKAIFKSPIDAVVGYIMEAEGVTKDVAQKRAYKYLEQDVATTIADAGEGAGKLLAELLKEEPAQ